MNLPKPNPGKHPKQRGFSLLELAIVAVIVSILFIVAADKLFSSRVEAERTAMESTLGTLRSALSIKLASYLAKDDMAGILRLQKTNPMLNLSELPKNYAGELNRPNPNSIEGGTWYFDTSDKILTYRVRENEYFRSSLPGPARARFAIRLVYQDTNANKVFDKGVDSLNGVRLTELEPYSWLTKKAVETNLK